MIVSFAWTTGAVIARRKRKTRRHWTPEYAACFRPGSVHQAYDRSPRFNGKQVALIRVLKAPYHQNTAEMTEHDFDDEGFAWMTEQGILMRGTTPRQFFEAWKEAREDVYVLEFEILSKEEPARLL